MSNILFEYTGFNLNQLLQKYREKCSNLVRICWNPQFHEHTFNKEYSWFVKATLKLTIKNNPDVSCHGFWTFYVFSLFFSRKLHHHWMKFTCFLNKFSCFSSQCCRRHLVITHISQVMSESHTHLAYCGPVVSYHWLDAVMASSGIRPSSIPKA